MFLETRQVKEAAKTAELHGMGGRTAVAMSRSGCVKPEAKVKKEFLKELGTTMLSLPGGTVSSHCRILQRDLCRRWEPSVVIADKAHT